MEVFKFQFKWAAVAGFQPPRAFGAVVVGHWVVGGREHASGGGEVTPTTYRRKRRDDTYLFLDGRMESSCLYPTGATVTLLLTRLQNKTASPKSSQPVAMSFPSPDQDDQLEEIYCKTKTFPSTLPSKSKSKWRLLIQKYLQY